MSRDISINPAEAKRLAKKLKYEDPEQFQTLVRMHLSFVLDLNMEEPDSNAEKPKPKALKWGFTSFTKKNRYPDRLPESSPLTQDIITQVFQLACFLIKDENLEQEGIFRRSGKVTRQQELKSLLVQGVEVDLNDGQFSVHDCASVLKGFLAELPEPLLTEAYYPAYCQIAELCQAENVSNERMLHALQLVLLLLPLENRKIMKEILRLLNSTASHASSNRMCAENLATLFTPHLLCPRKLSPEAFHINAQNLSCIVVFMIKEGLEVFEVPPALATDIKAYWDRRKVTPNHVLEESVSEAKTVFSFVDRARSGADATEKALAQLYAHVQALPESSKKRRLVNKFNKENGHGTPRTKTIGDSIKKHIFHKSAKAKSYNDTGPFKLLGSASSGDELNSPEYKTPLTSKAKLNFDSHAIPLLKPLLEPRRRRVDGGEASCDEGEESPPKMARVSPPDYDEGKILLPSSLLVTSTPAPLPGIAHRSSGPDDVSPITRSAQRMPRAMQEAMVTPRSRKPVVALSGSNLCHLGTTAWTTAEFTCNDSKHQGSWGEVECSSTGLTCSPTDLSFSSRPGDFDPWSSGDLGRESGDQQFPTPGPTETSL